MTDSLVLHLKEPVEASSTLHIPYGEKLQVCLALMSLEFFGDLPGLTSAQKSETEADLVTGDIV